MVIRQFLYPSEEDLYNLVRFLVGKLSDSSVAQTAALRDGYNRKRDVKEDEGETVQSEEILDGLKDLRLQTQASEVISRDDLAQRAGEPNSALHDVEIAAAETNPSKCSQGGQHSYLSDGVESSRSIDQNSSRVNLC